VCVFAVNWYVVGKVISGALTLLFAGTVAYVAWQQWKINERLATVSSRQYRLALFDRRLAIYNAVFARLVEIINGVNQPLLFQANVKFIRETRDHEFLFRPEVGQFIDSIWKRANELMTLQTVSGAPARQAEIIEWFDVQRAEARKVFFKYINLTDAI
jgi:hypothetical protein